jgi:hypothetical protein
LVGDLEEELHLPARLLLDHRLDGPRAEQLVAAVNGPQELEVHLLGHVVEIAAELGGQSRGQQAVGHQPSLRVALQVMRALVARELGEARDVVVGDLARPRVLHAGLELRHPVILEDFATLEA